MPDLNLTTADPAFDPDKPVRVNGYLFVPVVRLSALRDALAKVMPARVHDGPDHEEREP